jgi:integrase
VTVRKHKQAQTIQITFQMGAIRCRESLPLPPTPANIKFAKALRDEIMAKIVRGVFNYGEYFPKSPRAKKTAKPADTLTVGAMLDAFITDSQAAVDRGNMAPSTLDGYRKAVRHHLKPYFGAMLASEVTGATIRAWAKSVTLTAKTVRNTLIPLRAVFSDAINDDVVKANPFDRVALDRILAKSATPSTYVVDPFTPTEVAAICNAAKGQARNFIKFAFATGLRTSELIALRWSDVDMKARTVRVHRAFVLQLEKGPKTVAGNRVVELDDQAMAALEAQREWTLLQGKLVFHNPRTGKPLLDDQAVRKCIWKPAIEATDVRYRNPYQTRHTYASTRLSQGANLWWMAAQMGHEDVQTISRVYGKWIPEAGQVQQTKKGGA